MLGSLMPSAMPWGANNAWTSWLIHIMKPAKNLSLKKAAIINEAGQTVAGTQGFTLHPVEVQVCIVDYSLTLIMNSTKLFIPLHSLYWSIHTKDESKRGTAFAFIFGVN